MLVADIEDDFMMEKVEFVLDINNLKFGKEELIRRSSLEEPNIVLLLPTETVQIQRNVGEIITAKLERDSGDPHNRSIKTRTVA